MRARLAAAAARTAAAILTTAVPMAQPAAPAAAAPATPAPAPPAPAAPTPAAPAFRPCPRTVVAVPDRPPAPPVPAADPARRAVRGAALDTDGLAAPAGAPAPPALTATSWLVADLDTGAVLGACGPHAHGTPASVQKLLLAATLLPRLDPGREVTVVEQDLGFEPGSSAVGLLVGGRYPVRTLWLGLLLNSGNDAANVLARVGGGDSGVAGALAAMNARAGELGAWQTHAVTPSGLDGPGQFTSAYDLALIARACFAREDFRRYALTRTAQIPAQPALRRGGFQIQNENQLVTRYPGAIGGKTGFTRLARHTYVGAAERNGRRLVATVLGAEARPLRGWQQGAALLDWGFALPRDARVGELVGATAAASAPPAAAPGDPAPARAPAPAAPAGTGVALALAVAAAVAATPALLLAVSRRNRPGGGRRQRPAVR